MRKMLLALVVLLFIAYLSEQVYLLLKVAIDGSHFTGFTPLALRLLLVQVLLTVYTSLTVLIGNYLLKGRWQFTNLGVCCVLALLTISTFQLTAYFFPVVEQVYFFLKRFLFSPFPLLLVYLKEAKVSVN